MNTNKLKKRLAKNRPMTSVTLRMPADVIEDLKRVAPHRGFTGYQPLIRAYVGQGLRQDLETYEQTPEIKKLIASLRRQGIQETALEKAIADAGMKTA